MSVSKNVNYFLRQYDLFMQKYDLFKVLFYCGSRRGLSQARALKESKIPLAGVNKQTNNICERGWNFNFYFILEPLQATNDSNKELNKGKHKYETKVPK